MLAKPIKHLPSDPNAILDQPSLWTPERLQQISLQFEGSTPQQILQWGIQHFNGELALATSFGPQSIVLAHLLSQMEGQITYFFIDTSVLFPETYALREKLEARLGIQITAVSTHIDLETQSKQYGDKLWETDSNACCYIRKVMPLRQILKQHRAWITGIRREQASTRKQANLIEWDHTNQLVKLNPLAQWSKGDVWGYILDNELPYNELHDQGYPSIGCTHCTRPVGAGEDDRAGRWGNSAKTECGIHVRDDAQYAHLELASFPQ